MLAAAGAVVIALGGAGAWWATRDGEPVRPPLPVDPKPPDPVPPPVPPKPPDPIPPVPPKPPVPPVPPPPVPNPPVPPVTPKPVVLCPKRIGTIRQGLNVLGVPPASSCDGVLTVDATPWAIVTIDGREIGETPREVRLGAGAYRVRAAHPELGTRQETVTITAGKRQTWRPTFAK
jgi:hypothetical protein